MSDPLDAFVETIDIRKYFDESYETKSLSDKSYGLAAFRLLDEKPPEEVTVAKVYMEELKQYVNEMINDYGRGYTQTLTDVVVNTYTEGFIIKALRKMVNACCHKALIIPDYSPKDGRLHFHGVITFKRIKDMAKLKKMSKSFGWSSIDLEPKAGTAEYMFKIYEKNKYTPPNTKIESLPLKNMIIIKKI